MQSIGELNEQDQKELYAFFNVFIGAAYCDEKIDETFVKECEETAAHIYDPRSPYYFDGEELAAAEEHFKSREIFAKGVWFAMQQWMKYHGYDGLQVPEVPDYYDRDGCT